MKRHKSLNYIVKNASLQAKTENLARNWQVDLGINEDKRATNFFHEKNSNL